MFQRKQLRCSFCRRKEAEVSKLVAGPRVYICDRCVALASRLMEGGPEDQAQPPKAEPSVWRGILRCRIILPLWILSTPCFFQ